MMNLDDIDIDSWGEGAKEESKDAKAGSTGAIARVQDREISDSRKTDTPKRRSTSRKKPDIKILTASKVGDRIKKSKLGICGEKAVKNWFFRHKALDSASLTYLIEIFRELIKEGYQ